MKRLSIALCSLLAFMPLSMRADNHIDDWRNPPREKSDRELHLENMELFCSNYQSGLTSYERALNSTKSSNNFQLYAFDDASMTVEEIEENMRYVYNEYVAKDIFGNPKPPEKLVNPTCDYLLELM